MTRRLKVLISAYACSPYQGSEPGVGWGFVSALSKYHDLWVIVEEEKFRQELEKYLAADPEFRRRVQFYFIRKKRNRWLRKLWPPSYYWYYRRWHKDVLELTTELHAAVVFDLTHQLTMVGFREPGYLWQLEIPFVWGPIGGMGYFPLRFLPLVGMHGALYYLGYNIINFMHSHFLARPKRAALSAGPGLLVATLENQLGAQKYWGCKSTVIPETGLPCPVSRDTSSRKEGEALKIVWAGLHTPRKALILAINSLYLLDKKVRWELHVLGQGERTRQWRRDAQQKGIADRCQFHGWLAREEAFTVMKSSHILLITSLRDLTSTVTIEGLALGLPVICLDHCGFSHAITSDCGIKIPVVSPAQVSADIAVSITRLWENETWRRELAIGALRRAQAFSWEKKVEQLNEIYRRVVALR